MKRLVFLV